MTKGQLVSVHDVDSETWYEVKQHYSEYPPYNGAPYYTYMQGSEIDDTISDYLYDEDPEETFPEIRVAKPPGEPEPEVEKLIQKLRLISIQNEENKDFSKGIDVAIKEIHNFFENN